MKKLIYLFGAMALMLNGCDDPAKGGEEEPDTTLYQVTLSADTGAAVTNGQNGEEARTTGVLKGTTVSFSVEVDEEYFFGGWLIEPSIQGVAIDGATLTFEMPRNNITVRAVASLTPLYKVTIVAQTGITVNNGTNGQAARETGVPAGTAVAFQAVEDPEYTFDGWETTVSLPGKNLGLLALSFNMPESEITLTAKSKAKPKYTVTVATAPTSLATITVSPEGAQLAGTAITLTAPSADPQGYEFVNWTIGGLTLTNDTAVGDKVIKFNMPANNAGTATVNYKAASTGETAKCLAGEVSIKLSANTPVIWAASNLAGYQTFATNAYDFGCLFQWGYKNAIDGLLSASGATQSTVEMPNSTAQTGTVWPDKENPCPTGWRLPTRVELSNLIGNAYTTGAGSAEGGAFTSTAWTVGADDAGDKGMVVTPRAGDTEKKLLLPNVGQRTAAGKAGSGTTGARTSGYYWCSDGVEATAGNAYNLYFRDNTKPGYITDQGSKLVGYAVRCVR